MDANDRLWHYSDERLRVGRLVAGPLDNNVFLLVDAATNRSVIIDAAADPDSIERLAADTEVQAIVTTHGHWDHVGAADEVAARLQVPVMIGAADRQMSGLADPVDLEPGEMQLGELTLEVIATPGHTLGSHCVGVGGLLFTGDTLFPGGPGATRSPEDFARIMASLDDELFIRPGGTMILPGHGLDTTIGAERPHVEEWRARGW